MRLVLAEWVSACAMTLNQLDMAAQEISVFVSKK
jgi:hypothetical protein